MATKLTFSKPGFADRDAYTNLWDATIDTHIQRVEDTVMQGFQFVQKVTDNMPSLGSNDAITSRITSWSNILGLPVKSSDTAPLVQDQVAKGYTKDINIYTYRLGTRITRTLVKLDRSGRASEMLSGLPDSAAKLYEYSIADLFNNGQTTVGADDSYLFATDHYQENAGEGGTWSNLLVSAVLSPSSFDTMRIAMRRRKGERGFITPLKLDTLIHVADNEQIARQIATSDKIADSALMGDNPWKGVKPVCYDYLTSTTMWLGMDSTKPESSRGLHVVEFTAPEIKPGKLDEEILAAYKLYMQFGVGGSQVKSIVMNAGA